MALLSERGSLLTWAEINLSALRHNILEIRKKTRGREIIPVIKAGAYGHGAYECCKYLSEELEINNFGLARVIEGAALRRAGLTGVSLIILSGFFKGEIADIIKYSLEPSVFLENELKLLNLAAAAADKIISVHLKINTGMNRLGIKPEEAPGFFKLIKKYKNINLRSVYTHFANADLKNDAMTKKQAARLLQVKKSTPAGVFFHAASSAAAARYPDTYFDAVRPGIAIYGSLDAEFLKSSLNLKPVMTLKSRVINVLTLEKGESVSYAGLYRAKRRETIAIVAIGYGDGFPRSLTNKWHVMIKGKKAPCIGRVCMDLIAVKPPAGVKTGDEVLILGKDKNGAIKVEDMAAAAGTISYEIFTGINARVKRIYIK
jgi:alanine racemase